MENNSDNIFDDRLRRMLADAEEMPPERVWNGIVASMGAGTDGVVQRSRVRALWLSGLGLVSAAAAVAAFFLLHNTEIEDSTGLSSDIVAENIVTVETDEQIVSAGSSETAGRVENDGRIETAGSVENAGTMKTEATIRSASAEMPGEDSVPEASEAQPDFVEDNQFDTSPAETEVQQVDIAEDKGYYLADAEWNGTKLREKIDEDPVYELCIGGNSFVGPSRKTESIRMMSQGRFKIPTSTSFVENNDTDYYYLPMSFGVGIKFRIIKWLEIGIGVNYTLLMKRVSGNYYEYDSVGNLVRSCTAELKNSQHYIGIPLDVYFNIFGNEKWNTYASVGGCIEKCVCNRYNGVYDNLDINHKTAVEGIQTSVKAGLGVEYSPVKFLGIYLDPSLRYYFDNNQPRSIRTSQPLSFGVEAGLRFKL